MYADFTFKRALDRISSGFSTNSEAVVSEFVENLKDMYRHTTMSVSDSNSTKQHCQSLTAKIYFKFILTSITFTYQEDQ